MQNIKFFLRKHKIFSTIFAIHVMATLILIGLTVKLNALTTKYIALMVAILFVGLLCVASLLFLSRRKVYKIISSAISIILSSALIMASVYIYQGGDVIAAVTGAKTQTHVISVVVLADSKANSLDDLDGKVFGTHTDLTGDDEIRFKEVIDSIKEGLEAMSRSNYDSLNNAVSALYSGKVDAIILVEAYRGLCEHDYENFSTETKVIYSMEFEEDIIDVTKEVNVTKDTFTIFISGIDTYGPVSAVSNSDVNMLVTVNPVTRQILLTSIPRDMYITLASFGQKDKITHAGAYGINESISSINEWLGIDINYYARVNFTSFTNIVNALGGVTVNSPQAFTTKDGMYVKKGDNNFTGEEALLFARERYAFTSGDRERGQNQMRVLTAIINKMLSPAIITNYSRVLSSISGSFQTDMKSSDITDLIKMQLDNMSGWNIVTQQIDGTGSNDLYSYALKRKGVYVMVPNEDSVNSAIDKINSVYNDEIIK